MDEFTIETRDVFDEGESFTEIVVSFYDGEQRQTFSQYTSPSLLKSYENPMVGIGRELKYLGQRIDHMYKGR